MKQLCLVLQFAFAVVCANVQGQEVSEKDQALLNKAHNDMDKEEFELLLFVHGTLSKGLSHRAESDPQKDYYANLLELLLKDQEKWEEFRDSFCELYMTHKSVAGEFILINYFRCRKEEAKRRHRQLMQFTDALLPEDRPPRTRQKK